MYGVTNRYGIKVSVWPGYEKLYSPGSETNATKNGLPVCASKGRLRRVSFYSSRNCRPGEKNKTASSPTSSSTVMLMVDPLVVGNSFGIDARTYRFLGTCRKGS